jgi:hypothetical protein
MFRFDKTGKYVGEIGQASYAMLFAEKVKVDPQDNIWVVDQMANTVMEFDSEGRLVMLLGRKAESEVVPARGAAPPAGPWWWRCRRCRCSAGRWRSAACRCPRRRCRRWRRP